MVVMMAPGSTQSLSDDRGGAHIACSRSARSSTTRRSVHNLQTADHQAARYDPSVVSAKRGFKSHYDCSSD